MRPLGPLHVEEALQRYYQLYVPSKPPPDWSIHAGTNPTLLRNTTIWALHTTRVWWLVSKPSAAACRLTKSWWWPSTFDLIIWTSMVMSWLYTTLRRAGFISIYFALLHYPHLTTCKPILPHCICGIIYELLWGDVGAVNYVKVPHGLRTTSESLVFRENLFIISTFESGQQFKKSPQSVGKVSIWDYGFFR